MTKLALLRSRLAGLRRRRAALRWGTGWSGFGIAVVCVVLAVFLVDWTFSASVTQRVALWIVGLAAIAWAWWRYARPWLGTSESDEEMALLVERQQGIDSDLVAAMQFEAPRAAAWGSPQLETAVVDYVAEFSPTLDVYEGLDTEIFRRRMLAFAGLAAALVLAAVAFPAHAAAFGDRMLLGRTHYPTATRIESLAVNGTTVWPVSRERLALLEQRRSAALDALDVATERLSALHAAARAESNTSEGPLDRWFGPDEPVADAARVVASLRDAEHEARDDVRGVDFARFDDLSELLREQRHITRRLDELAGRMELAALATPLAEARSAAHAAAAAVGRLAPTIPYGHPLEVRVRLTGDVPESARIVLTSLGGDARTELELRPNETATDATGGDEPTTFSAELPRMVDSVGCRLYAGDAWTDPNVVAVVPLPAVTVELSATPPEYAAAEQAVAPPGQLQQSVVEGSRVDLVVECSNKPLESATVGIGDETYPLEPVDDDRRRWSLAPAGTPFEEVRDAQRFEVRVVDVDGLSLERPIQGYVRIQPDRVPRVRASIKYGLPVALPNASPSIEFAASDDFGLSRLAVRIEVERGDGTTTSDVRVLRRLEPGDAPLRELSGDQVVDFAPLGLELGDQLRLVFEATDHRGTLEPRSSTSEPLAFRIAGEAEVLREMQKLDAKAERDLDVIIRRELGIGESP